MRTERNKINNKLSRKQNVNSKHENVWKAKKSIELVTTAAATNKYSKS